MGNDYPINRASALDERRGPHDDSGEILVKTPGNNGSLRLNTKPSKDHDRMVWQVTLPFEGPLNLIKENNKWVSFGKSHAALSLIEASVSEIAYEPGFKYLQHFTRLFKQRTGYTPQEYRSLN